MNQKADKLLASLPSSGLKFSKKFVNFFHRRKFFSFFFGEVSNRSVKPFFTLLGKAILPSDFYVRRIHLVSPQKWGQNGTIILSSQKVNGPKPGYVLSLHGYQLSNIRNFIGSRAQICEASWLKSLYPVCAYTSV